MRSVQKLVLSGVAAAALGVSGTAMGATGSTSHDLTIHLPGGGTEEISFTGNVAPEVIVLPNADTLIPSVFLHPSAGFKQISAQMDQIAADIDRDMASAIKKANASAAISFGNPKNLNTATFKSMPAGSESYTFASTMSDGKTCSRSVQITSMGIGKQPKVVSHSSGNCASTNSPNTVPDITAAFWDFPNNALPLKVSVHLPSAKGSTRQPA